jgi:glycosyltransferase involved in cell wall biosynthesis
MDLDLSIDALKALAATRGPSEAGLSVIMPAYNAAHYLKLSLPPLAQMLRDGEILELVVVDDRSTDDTAAVAASFGARVLTMPKNMGPGAARNYAALQARGDVLWFVDADVIARTGSGALIRKVLADEGVDAVFGSYDDQPPARNFASQYKNLVHRFYHQRGARDAATFWAGCGAMRTETFLKVGGYDIVQFKRPSIEDIELGYRVRDAGGRITLEPSLVATHLKHWTLGGVIHTDIFCRALPWSRLMLSRKGVDDDLNVANAERARAVLAGLFVASFVTPLIELSLWPVPLAMLAAVVLANWTFLAFMTRLRGPLFGLASLLFHQLYYIYAAVSFVYCVLERKRPGSGAKPPADGEAQPPARLSAAS